MRHFFTALAQVDTQQALHDAWVNTSPEVHVASGTTGFAAWFAGVNWAAVAAFLSVTVPLGFGLIVQCFKQISIAQIAIREAQIASDDRIAARRAAEQTAERVATISTIPGWVLVPDTAPSA
jgi:hypothetical protein